MKLNARKLRYILLGLVLLVLLGTIGGFYVAQARLHDYAASITQLNANADIGDKDVRTLQQLDRAIQNSQSTIDSTRAIVSESKQYQYQNQIIEDIVSIAKRSGVTVTAFEFTDSSAAPGAAAGAAAGSAPAAAPTAPAATTDASGGQASTGEVKSVVTNVTIENPVAYGALMNFIKAIELNRMKMQIAKVSLSGEKDGNVTSQTFAIEVYIR